MTAATQTLADFLLACMAEDEANIDGDWAGGDGGLHIISTAMRERMLAECEAKRRLVDLHKPLGITGYGPEPIVVCDECGPFEDVKWRAPNGNHPCETLRILALPYADREGYREEWRP